MDANLRTGGHILIEQLALHGADTVFGVPGESFLAALDGMYQSQRVRFINARHEGGAAMMADAYGKLTGRPGIAFATRGPGATNASAGVHVAFQDSTPMILLLGQVGRDVRCLLPRRSLWETSRPRADQTLNVLAPAASSGTCALDPA
jgi:acetolactate synthase-1/2/3 large subunit